MIDNYINTLCEKYKYTVNRLPRTVRFYQYSNGKIIKLVELSKDYLKECMNKGIEPKELIKPINPELEGCGA